MDRYKHNASTQRRIKCAPNPTQTENSGVSAGIQSINGTGVLKFSNLSIILLLILTVKCVFRANVHWLRSVFQVTIRTTTNAFLMAPACRYAFPLLVWTHISASPTTTGKMHSLNGGCTVIHVDKTQNTDQNRKSCVFILTLTWKYIFSLLKYLCFLQPFAVSLPAHSCSGSPWGHALRTFRHLPPQPFPASPRL